MCIKLVTAFLKNYGLYNFERNIIPNIIHLERERRKERQRERGCVLNFGVVFPLFSPYLNQDF